MMKFFKPMKIRRKPPQFDLISQKADLVLDA